MKTRKTILTLAIVFALIFIACEKDPDPKTYTVTFDADGEDTQQCLTPKMSSVVCKQTTPYIAALRHCERTGTAVY